MTKLLGQLQDVGNTTTLSHYLELLDSAGLLVGLEKYAPDVARQRMSIPNGKFKTQLLHRCISRIVLKKPAAARCVG